MNPSARYLHVLPRGIAEWLTQAPDARQPDQRLFRTLLRQPHNTTPLSMEWLSQSTGLSRGQVARSLFSLHRLGSIQVAVDAPAAPRAAGHPAANIHQQLQRLCGDTAGAAVLADPDGLCMASHGVAHDDAQGLAAGFAPFRHAMVRAMPLFIGRRPCRLHITSSALVDHEAFVGLVRSLHELLAD
ncbi:MAG: hypothetical protein A3E51_02540 [Burkholderiales bacterium RIFCSPHIGHO2_12_FULL_67_38]|nr:MAG: hypothetical protein A3I64_04525 [Burkholderiales bacterium RIFCSPLOWO2_02_FULL_67_64]OGB38477.1 MAG: hypothetical protein A3E51_02540 [Burkholderiales bacterium RIFCSPHIGHO2_12_FULL_67_38]